MGLSRTAFRKGVMGGSRAWTWFGVAIWTVKAFRWLGRRPSGVAMSQRLRPGDSLQITAVRPSKRSDRRATSSN